jgi:hypothetical protein
VKALDYMYFREANADVDISKMKVIGIIALTESAVNKGSYSTEDSTNIPTLYLNMHPHRNCSLVHQHHGHLATLFS